VILQFPTIASVLLETQTMMKMSVHSVTLDFTNLLLPLLALRVHHTAQPKPKIRPLWGIVFVLITMKAMPQLVTRAHLAIQAIPSQ